MKLSERIRKTKELPWQRELTDEIADKVESVEDALPLSEDVRGEALRIAKKDGDDMLAKYEEAIAVAKSKPKGMVLSCENVLADVAIYAEQLKGEIAALRAAN